MSSPFAERFNARARPLLWQQHAETLTYRRPGQVDAPLRVIFRREDAAKPDAGDGLGVEGYSATATAVVLVSELPEVDGAALLLRDGVTWAIRRSERQDAWTWILHLAQPEAELRLPERMRG